MSAPAAVDQGREPTQIVLLGSGPCYASFVAIERRASRDYRTPGTMLLTACALTVGCNDILGANPEWHAEVS